MDTLSHSDNTLSLSGPFAQAIMNSLGEGVMVADARGRLTYMNPAAERILGWTMVDLLGKVIHETIHHTRPDGSPFPIEECPIFGIVQSCQAEQDYEDFMIDRNGQYIPVRISCYPLMQDGALQGIVASFRDMRERLKEEEALRQSEDRYRLILEAIQDGVWDYNLADGKIYWNDQLYRMAGLSRDTFQPTDQNVWELIHPEDRETVRNLVEAHIASPDEVPYNIQYRLRHSSGKYLHTIAKGRMHCDSQGKPLRMVGVQIDVTEAKEAELALMQAMEALRESEARFRWLSDSNMVGVVFADVYGHIHEANDAFLDMVGYSPEDLQSGRMDWMRMTPPEYLIPYGDLLDKVRSESCIRSQEQQYIRKDGSRVDVLLSVTLLEGSMENTVAFVQDITEQKRAERDLQESRETLRRYAQELEQNNRMLADFASVASHDLKAPLRKVRLFSEMLCDLPREALSPEHQDYIGRIHNAVLRMESLINDLLTLARISTGGGTFERVDLGALAQEVLHDFEEQIRESNAQVTLAGSAELLADSIQMGQLLQNLVENALKFRQPDVPPEVSIRIETLDGERCQIRVQDNGIGFAPQNAERIFSTFVRLHGTSEYPGTGIGLAICKKIIERHGGTIEAKGMPNAGALFTVILPLSPEPIPPVPEL